MTRHRFARFIGVAAAAALVGAGAAWAARGKATRRPATEPAAGSGLVLSTWAPTGFLKNPTALSFDRQGRCYVAQTQRREGGEMQSRSDPVHKLIPDHTFTTVEDRARFGGKGDAAWGDQIGGRKETITLLEDSTGDGRADKATVFYQGFNHNINGILAGVLWHDGFVYATVAPDLWRLRDDNGDGRADTVQSICHGFAVHMGYPGHNMHGLCVGPDGKIYCTMGDKGINLELPGGKRLDYHNTGTVVRMNPDGSDPEVFCYGVRNTFEVDFDKFGNLFAVDNDGDFPTERERFVYLTQDSDSGWRFHWQFRSAKNDVQHPAGQRHDRYNVWMNEKLWVPYFKGQASYILPPLSNYSDGPAGFKYATEGCLDARYAGCFFITQFPKAVISAFRAEPKGAGFAMTDERTVVRGTQCVGLAFGPDGALYGAEWGKSGFKLGNTGSVVKLDDPAAADSPLRRETHRLLREGPHGRSEADLVKLLGNADMRVREDAQFELARRKSVDAFLSVAFSTGERMSRIHALWGLGQLVDAKALDKAAVTRLADRLLAQTCADGDAELRAQGVKLLGDLVRHSGPIVSDSGVFKLLDDPSPRVRYFAAVALGRFADPRAVPALLHLADANRPLDPYIRLAATLGLVGSGDADQLAAAESNPSEQARLVAVVALRRLRSPLVARFLGDKDETVVTEAARAIHDDDSIPAALPALARVADRPGLTSEALIRRALNANLRLGGAECIARLVNYAEGDHNPPAMRVEALDMLAHWEDPAVNDRVEGIYRVWPRRQAGEVAKVIAPALPALLAAGDDRVSRAAAELIDRLHVETDSATFAEWVGDAARSPASRAAALHLLASRKFAKLPEMIDVALKSQAPALRAEALRVLAATDPARAAAEIARVLAGDAPIVEKQVAYALLPELKSSEAERLLADSLDRLDAGTLAPQVRLDAIEAASAVKSPALSKKLSAYDARLNPKDPLAPYDVCLQGGDPERGREVFMGQTEFACIGCHSVDGTGSAVGPNLAGIGAKRDKPPHYLLESLIEPSAYIVPGYGVASFTLKDGRTLSGFVRAQDAGSIHLQDLEGVATTIARADVASSVKPTSMMPAMGAVLTKPEIRDVIAYLESLK